MVHVLESTELLKSEATVNSGIGFYLVPYTAKAGGGGYTLAGRRGVWGVNILEDEIHRIALLQ